MKINKSVYFRLERDSFARCLDGEINFSFAAANDGEDDEEASNQASACSSRVMREDIFTASGGALDCSGCENSVRKSIRSAAFSMRSSRLCCVY